MYVSVCSATRVLCARVRPVPAYPMPAHPIPSHPTPRRLATAQANKGEEKIEREREGGQRECAAVLHIPFPCSMSIPCSRAHFTHPSMRMDMLLTTRDATTRHETTPHHTTRHVRTNISPSQTVTLKPLETSPKPLNHQKKISILPPRVLENVYKRAKQKWISNFFYRAAAGAAKSVEDKRSIPRIQKGARCICLISGTVRTYTRMERGGAHIYLKNAKAGKKEKQKAKTRCRNIIKASADKKIKRRGKYGLRAA